MKFLIASDIHGSATWCRRLMDALDAEQPDRLLLLGDILYHGPRNDLPEGYAPKEVIAMLNPLAQQIIAVRGNCEAEVDQMVLGFPCMGDYTTIFDPDAPLAPDGSELPLANDGAKASASSADAAVSTASAPAAEAPAASAPAGCTCSPRGCELFLTHGHVYGAGFHNSIDKLPELPEGSILLYGHTHIKVSEPAPSHPGVWAFNPGSVSIPKDGTHSYGIYENGALRHVLLEV